MQTQRSGSSLGGCLIGLALGMIAGLLVGVGATLDLIGLDADYLVARVSGTAPALIAATPEPPPPAAIQGAAPGRRLVLQAPIPLDSDTNEPELLIISRNYDRGGDSLIYFSPDQKRVIWESASFSEEGFNWLVRYNADTIFLADDTRLLALNRSDGALRWEAQLSDSISDSICRDCFQAFDTVVAALSQDGEVHVFDAADGSMRWQMRLRQATRQLLYFNGMLGVIDERPDQASAGSLYLYDLTSGNLAGEIAPNCTNSRNGREDYPHFYDLIYVGPDEALYWYLDSAGCIMRLEPGEQEVRRWAELPEDVSLDEATIVFGNDTFYAQDDARIIAVSADGTTRIVIENEDYYLKPIIADSDVLLVEAQRTRGSSRTELWMIALSDGTMLSSVVLTASTQVQGNSTGDWAAAITPAGVALLETLDDDEEMLRYRLYNRSSGELLVDRPLDIEDPTALIRGIYWDRATVVLAADELYGVTLADGTIRYRWP